MESINDFNEINTVQDLLEFNETPSDPDQEVVDKLCKEIFENAPNIGLKIAKVLLEELAHFHAEVANKKSEEHEPDVLGWSADYARLEAASKLIDDIYL